MKKDEIKQRRPFAPGIQWQLMLFIGGITLFTLLLVWGIITYALEPQYNRNIRAKLDSKAAAITALIDQSDAEISSRTYQGLYLNDEFWSGVSQTFRDKKINVDGNCVDFSDSTLRCLKAYESMYPCLLHESTGAFGGEFGYNLDTRIAIQLRQKLFRQITPAEGDALLEVFRAEGRMKRAENRWALAEFSIRLTKRQTALRDALLERFLRSGPEPDTVEAVLDSIPPEEARQVLESLLTGGELVRLSPELCWHREVFQKGLDILRTLCADHGAVTLAEVRDAFDTTRKYALLFLEACDRRQITVREGDCRRLKLKFHD